MSLHTYSLAHLYQVQEILLYHHLALVTSRTYVYQPFVWRPRNHQPLPLSAFLPGLTEDAVPVTLFHLVCAPEETIHITIDASYENLWEESKRALEGPERCITVDTKIMHWKCVYHMLVVVCILIVPATSPLRHCTKYGRLFKTTSPGILSGHHIFLTSSIGRRST